MFSLISTDDIKKMLKQQMVDRKDIDLLLEKSEANDVVFKQHAEMICDYLEYKKQCVENHKRREGEHINLVEANKGLTKAVLELSQEFKRNTDANEKNSESLQLIANVVTTYNTGKKALPVMAVLAGWIVAVVIVVLGGWFYLKASVEVIIDWVRVQFNV